MVWRSKVTLVMAALFLIFSALPIVVVVKYSDDKKSIWINERIDKIKASNGVSHLEWGEIELIAVDGGRYRNELFVETFTFASPGLAIILGLISFFWQRSRYWHCAIFGFPYVITVIKAPYMLWPWLPLIGWCFGVFFASWRRRHNEKRREQV